MVDQELERRMNGELQAALEEFTDFIRQPFLRHVRGVCEEQIEACRRAQSGQARELHELAYAGAKNFILEQLRDGNLFNDAYQHAIGQIRGRYADFRREIEQRDRAEALARNAAAGAGGGDRDPRGEDWS